MNFSQKKFTKEFLLSGNRLLDCCNRLPVAKLFWKSFQIKFTTFQLISKSYNQLQCFGNRLPVPLNVEIQIQMWRVPSFHIKALCNRLHWFGNLLPVIVSEQIKRSNSSNSFWLFQIGFKFFLKVITLLIVLLTRHEESI